MHITKMPSQGRAAILWGLAFVCLAQLGLTIFIQRWRPDLGGDAEYGVRLRNLRQRIRAEPKRPLLLILGSSRTANGIKVDCLPIASGSREAPLVYNMSQTAATPLYELLILKRLLAAGIHPRWLVIEVHNLYLTSQGKDLANRDAVFPDRLHWTDLEVLDRYAPEHGWYRFRKRLQGTVLPWYWSRDLLMSQYAPSWLEPAKAARGRFWGFYIKPSGWFPFPFAFTPEQQKTAFNTAVNLFSENLASFQVCPQADHLYREMLEICRKENITVLGLLEMPIESRLRAMYSREVCQKIDCYLTSLCREYDTKLIDASDWLSDEGNFFDGHHLLPGAAEEFTLRLWKEILEPRLREDCCQSRFSQDSQSEAP